MKWHKNERTNEWVSEEKRGRCVGEVNGWRFSWLYHYKIFNYREWKASSEREKDEVDFDCKISKCGSSIVAFETFAIKHKHTDTHIERSWNVWSTWRNKWMMLLIGIKKRCHVQLKNSLKAHKNLFPFPYPFPLFHLT